MISLQYGLARFRPGFPAQGNWRIWSVIPRRSCVLHLYRPLPTPQDAVQSGARHPAYFRAHPDIHPMLSSRRYVTAYRSHSHTWWSCIPYTLPSLLPIQDRANIPPPLPCSRPAVHSLTNREGKGRPRRGPGGRQVGRRLRRWRQRYASRGGIRRQVNGRRDSGS